MNYTLWNVYEATCNGVTKDIAALDMPQARSIAQDVFELVFVGEYPITIERTGRMIRTVKVD